MKLYLKHVAILLTLLVALTAAVFWLAPAQSAQALPEYSAQTGEPCATCHISPSGGGSRGPRGQAWVGSGKPGEVPLLADALEILGVNLTMDEAAFTSVPETFAPAEPLAVEEAVAGPGREHTVHNWLKSYAGN